MLKESYTGNYEKIANGKRGNMETGGYERIVMKEFPPGFECVKSSCKTARRILFPYGGEGLIVGTPQDPEKAIRSYHQGIYDDAISLVESGNCSSTTRGAIFVFSTTVRRG